MSINIDKAETGRQIVLMFVAETMADLSDVMSRLEAYVEVMPDLDALPDHYRRLFGHRLRALSEALGVEPTTSEDDDKTTIARERADAMRAEARARIEAILAGRYTVEEPDKGAPSERTGFYL